MNIDLNTPIQQKSDIVSADVGEDVMLLGIQQAAYYDLKQTGGRIWSLLAEPTPLSAVCDVLVQEFEVDQQTCEQEVLSFAQRMLDEGLIELASPKSK